MKRILVTAGTLLGLFALAATFMLVDGDALSIHNDAPEGAGSLARTWAAGGHTIQALASDLRVLDEIEEPKGHLLVMLAPGQRPTASDLGALDRFVIGGGRVLIADDATTMNVVARPWGVTFAGVPVQDTAFHVRQEVIPASLDLAHGHDLYVNGPGVLFLDPGAIGQVIGTTSPTSFLDLDGDGHLGDGDQLGPFPLAFESRMLPGGGRYVFVSDAHVAANEMRNAPGTRDALTALADHLLPHGGTIIFDERGKGSGAVRLHAMATGTGTLLANPLFIAAAATGLGLAISAGVRRRHDPFPLDHRHTPEADVTPVAAREILANK